MTKQGDSTCLVPAKSKNSEERLLSGKEFGIASGKPVTLLRDLEILSDYYLMGVQKTATNYELRTWVAEATKIYGCCEEEALHKLAQDMHQVDEIINRYHGDKEALIQILLDINTLNHWLPKTTLWWVSARLSVPLSRIYHIASFYKAFSLIPQGRHVIQVCLGTACQVRGAPRLLDMVMNALKILPGETDRDKKFTLTTVNCLGCCALGPVMLLDEDHYSNPTQDQIKSILSKYN
jgi:NADH-quinone oxidoreductase subunit E